MSAIIYRSCRSIKPENKKTCSEVSVEVIRMISEGKNHGLGVKIIPQCPKEKNCEYKEDRIRAKD